MTNPDLVGGLDPSTFPRQSGTVLVCANGWTLHDDLARARRIFPNVPVIAVNGAAGAVRAFALFSLHPRKLRGWRQAQMTLRGYTDQHVTTHAAGNRHKFTKLGHDTQDHDVDVWWPEALSRGSSGWSARKLARLMGFDQVVLCGVPLAKGKYAAGKEFPKAWQIEDTINHYRSGVLEDTDYHEGVVSMSGWTREIFGGPEGDHTFE